MKLKKTRPGYEFWRTDQKESKQNPTVYATKGEALRDAVSAGWVVWINKKQVDF